MASHFTRGEREAQRASGRTLEPGGGLEGDTRLRPDPVPGSGDVGPSEGARGETGSSPVFVSKAPQEVLLKHRGGRSRRSQSAGGNKGQVSFQKIREGCGGASQEGLFGQQGWHLQVRGWGAAGTS